MADSTLNYGHFGHATYRLENSDWSFTRQTRGALLKPLGIWSSTLSPTVHFETTQDAAAPRSTQRAARKLARQFPHLAAAADILHEDAIISAAATSTIASYDPSIGDLLSFGSIALDGHFWHPRRVAALATGEGGNILRLVLLQRERQGWEGDKSIWIEGQTLAESESGYWNEDATAIQQVCFAQSEDRSSFLAVRLLQRTVLFRPTYYHRRKPACQSKYYRLPPSTIDLCPILRIDIGQTGGAPHADVAFNPDFQRQFAIIDQKGAWSVWDIEDGQRGGKYSVARVVQGTIQNSRSEPRTTSEKSAREDGWARLSWVGDTSTLAVCNRRELAIFDIKSGAPTPLRCTRLISKRSPNWILDLKRHPRRKDQFFVLTSKRLFLLGVTCMGDVVESARAAVGTHILLSWRHFRDYEDTSLQLCPYITSDQETYVVVHSKFNSITTVFTFLEDDSGATKSKADPVLLNLEGGLSNPTTQNPRITKLHVEQLQFGGHERETTVGPGRMYMANNVKFFRVIAFSADRSVHQLLLYSYEPSMKGPSQMFVALTIWNKIIHPRRTVPATEECVSDVDIVDPEGLDYPQVPTFKSPLHPPRHARGHGSWSYQSAINYAFLYRALADTTQNTAVEETVDVAEVIAKAKKMLVEFVDVDDIPIGTLIEIAGRSLLVSDVDEASSKLQEIFPQEAHSDSRALQSIASRHVIGLDTADSPASPTIASLYDVILQTWVASLPPHIPISIRQRKERLARRIAAEVILASSRIREPQFRISSHYGLNQDGAVASLPTPPASEGLWPSSQAPPQYPHFPSSQPSSSILPSSSLPSTPTTPHVPTVVDPLSRLSKHLKVVKQSEPLHSSISQILSHWQPGSDPSAYDWKAIERSIDDELELEEEGSQAKREKVKRKRERLEKRQRREDELVREKTTSQSQFPRSSPGPFLGAPSMLSSQPQSQGQHQDLPGGFVVQSQVEPGKHGGRPAKKKKLKSRMSGF